MKLSQIVSPPFTQTLRKLVDAKLPVLTAYRLKTITARVEDEQGKFEDLRRKLVEKYAERDEKGEIKKAEDGTYKVAEASVKDFMEEIGQLTNIDVDLPTLRIVDLGSIELSARDLSALEGLIVE